MDNPLLDHVDQSTIDHLRLETTGAIQRAEALLEEKSFALRAQLEDPFIEPAIRHVIREEIAKLGMLRSTLRTHVRMFHDEVTPAPSDEHVDRTLLH